MHIALCHDAVIPPTTYGGTERVVALLARGLIELGHRVTLVARAGSRVDGAELEPYRADWADRASSSIDIIHLRGTPARAPSRPFVVTIDGNGRPGERFHANTIFVSRRHAENHGSRHFVYNGIDLSTFRVAPKRNGSLVFLAKASWKVKNLGGAIAVARKAGMQLEVLGSRNWPLALQRRLPRMLGVRYHGMVDDAAKAEILSEARALLFPVRWHEPFGLAVVEALASGCAVFGTPYGSLPELVTPNVGLLSADGREWVSVLGKLDRFAPEACRAHAREHFSYLEMARSYVRFYESVAATGHLPGGATPSPATRAGFHAQSLLPWLSP